MTRESWSEALKSRGIIGQAISYLYDILQPGDVEHLLGTRSKCYLFHKLGGLMK